MNPRRDNLARQDAKIHRCRGCGAWCYDLNGCTTPTCVAQVDAAVALILGGEAA